MLKVDIKKSLGSFVLETKFECEDVFAILGASGSGKTMTLKCIAGVEKPDEGRIELDGRVLFDSKEHINVPARKREVGFLFQEYALFPNMTVRKNIECTAKDKSRVDDIIAKFGLSQVKDQYPSELSGGQSQRTAIARMLLTEPKMLMFDEPFSALDNYLQFQIEQELFKLISEFSGPVILVSHDRNEVYRMADTIGVMENGKLIDVQGKKEFFSHPMTVASTRLTGCKNISRVSRVEGKLYKAKDWGINITIPDGNADDINFVGYRAHYFELVDRDESENVFKCEIIRVVEDTFSVMILFRQAGNQMEGSDTVLTFIVSKPRWDEIKDKVTGNTFFLKIDSSMLILLDR